MAHGDPDNQWRIEVRQGSVISERVRRQQWVFAAYGVAMVLLVGVAYLVEPVLTVEWIAPDVIIYGNALLTAGCSLGAYTIQERLRGQVLSASSAESALDILFRYTLYSAGAMELSAWGGLVGFVLSGDAASLLFVLPFFVVLALIFPTRDRVAVVLGSAE